MRALCISSFNLRSMSFIHFTQLLLVAALAASFCIQGAPADPADHLPDPCSWHSKKASLDDESTRNLTLFKLSFLKNHSSFSFTFTTTYGTAAEDQGAPATLAFILVTSEQLPSPSPPPSAAQLSSPSPRSGAQSVELSLMCITQQFIFSHQSLPPHFCNPLPQPKAPTTCPSEPVHPYDSNQTHFKDKVSFKFDADDTALQVQAAFYIDGLETNNTFSLSTNDLPPERPGDSTVRKESIAVFVGYITSEEATYINGSTMISAPSPIDEVLDIIDDDVIDDDNNAKSDHHTLWGVVVWVIVGVCMMGILIGLLILVLYIKKRRGRRPSLVNNSRPAIHGAPPSSTTSKVPISHHDLESSAAPMMRALPLSPPYTHAFETSGTNSWLKHPNAR